jgi:hypothetical protein
MAKFTPAKPKTAPSRVPKTAVSVKEQEVINDRARDKGRVDFRVDRFITAIRQKGYHLIWRKAIICPCQSAETEQPRVDCDSCDGSGFFYIEPLAIQGIMTNLEKKKDQYRHLGEWLEGTSQCTVEPLHRLGYRDSLQMVHSVMTFNEWITKNDRHGTRSRLPDNVDAARYRIVNALHLFIEDANGQPKQLEAGVWFDINKNGWIEWRGPGLDIPEGTLISVNYEFRPVWIVINHVHGVRDTITTLKESEATVQAMPVQAAVKLDYLTSDTTLPSTEVC